MSTYKLLRVSTGEEIMFTVKTETPTTYIASNPIAFAVVPKGDQYGLQLFPYSPANPEGDQVIFKDKVVSESIEPPEGLIRAYIQRTTGIEIAQAF